VGWHVWWCPVGAVSMEPGIWLLIAARGSVDRRELCLLGRYARSRLVENVLDVRGCCVGQVAAEGLIEAINT
jgi:hypothetical protein